MRSWVCDAELSMDEPTATDGTPHAYDLDINSISSETVSFC